jgi:ribulose-5-phosphate 4-epimerase/fuculose-1-phosphate aldolase/catechol 2,3-dioxygenase-like lactoylglutathione lyase family enzyme
MTQQKNPISVRDIDHLVLRVIDLERMLSFYCGVLGCSIERRQDDLGLVQLRAGGSLIDLVPVGGKLGAQGGAAPGREGRNVDHFCLRLDTFDEKGLCSYLVERGVPIGEVASRYGAEGEGPSIYLSDPEGNTVELKGPPSLRCSADAFRGEATAESSALQVSSMRGHCSAAEWQARVDLAACYRLVALYGMSDMMANHISARVPGEQGAFLINAYGMLYEEITASSLLKIDHNGEILSLPDFGTLNYGVNKAGYVIHSAVHAARADVECVIHTHSWASMAVSTLECGLLPITQTAMRFLKIGYHDYCGVVLNLDEQASLIRDLGSGEALILRNHGALIVGRTIGEAFNWMHRLELACRSQLAAMACNTKLVQVLQPVLEETWSNYQPQTRRPFGVMEWPALLRKLDRINPGYRD